VAKELKTLGGRRMKIAKGSLSPGIKNGGDKWGGGRGVIWGQKFVQEGGSLSEKRDEK